MRLISRVPQDLPILSKLGEPEDVDHLLTRCEFLRHNAQGSLSLGLFKFGPAHSCVRAPLGEHAGDDGIVGPGLS